MFVIDERDAASRSSINLKGHDQTDLTGLFAEVKDSARNPDKWAYYVLNPDGKTTEAYGQYSKGVAASEPGQLGLNGSQPKMLARAAEWLVASGNVGT
jgi:hypothetical protein